MFAANFRRSRYSKLLSFAAKLESGYVICVRGSILLKMHEASPLQRDNSPAAKAHGFLVSSNVSPCQRDSARWYFAGWCGLLLYASASSPLGLGLAAGLGLLDCDHRLTVQTGTAGTRLVLHHDQPGALHHHGPVARAMTWFADASRTHVPDHVLQFNVSDSFFQLRQFFAPAPTQLDQPILALAESPACSPREAFLFAVPTHPPRRGTEQLLCLRSTLLLI